jgi:hypothetical protein
MPFTAIFILPTATEGSAATWKTARPSLFALIATD